MTTNDSNIDAGGILDTLEIKKVLRRGIDGGAWVSGTIGGYRFEALVFPGPALRREWEVNSDSYISKLWIADADRKVVYDWDRGPGTLAANPTVEMIVELLADGLAETIFA